MVSFEEFHLSILVLAFCTLPVFAGSLKFLRLSETNLIVLLGCVLWVFGLIELLALPITNWWYPLNIGTNSQWLGCILLGLLFLVVMVFWALSSLFYEHGSRRFWLKIAGLHEGFLLLLIPRACHDEYKWHIRWRFELWGRKILRHWQRFSAPKFFRGNRWLWVICAGGLAAILALFVLSGGEWFKLPTADQLAKMRESSGSWTLLTALVSAPIAFVIWCFRDTNTLWQIENQRKDINLKDFQKLAEWASGLHIAEDISTFTQEHIGGTLIDTKKSTETTAPAANQVFRTPSRSEGAASLQIAAVVQLQAFLHGEFGHQFERPAFTLLTSIWMALMKKHVDALDAHYDTLIASLSKVPLSAQSGQIAFDQWRINLQREAQGEPLAKAITQALMADHGSTLRTHKELLPNLLLAGMSCDSLDEKGLELDGLNLQSILWSGAALSRAQLQSADLRWAKLEGSNFLEAQLQCINLSLAKVQGANLCKAQLQGGSMGFTDFFGADFSHAQVQGAIFHRASLNCTKLNNLLWDEATNFEHATTDFGTQVAIFSDPVLDCVLGNPPLPLLTHAARLKLREQNKLELPLMRYTEFLPQWNAVDKPAQDKAKKIVGTKLTYAEDVA